MLTFPMSFHSMLGSNNEFDVKNINNYKLRSSKLKDCLEKVEEAEALLREARVDAVSSCCHGVLYRIDNQLEKIVKLRSQIIRKCENLEARD